MTSLSPTPRKDTGFTVLDQRAAEIAKAIAHPARITILRLLAERGTCVCGEVVNDLPLSQSTVSQHLKALKESGLIRSATDGPRSCYCLNLEALAQAAATLTEVMTGIRKAAVGCGCEPAAVNETDAASAKDRPAASGAAAPPASPGAAGLKPATLNMLPSASDAAACGLDGYC